MENLEFGRTKDGFVGECGRKMCRICWQSHVRDEVLGRADFAEMAELIDQILDAYCQEGEDNNYHQAILDGSWFTSVQQLEHALIRAKSKRDAHPELYENSV